MTATLIQDTRRAAAQSVTSAVTSPWEAFRLVVRVLTTIVMVIAVAAFLFLAIGPRVLGYQTSTMLTGSMAPMINPGDVVVSVPTPASKLRVGDVVTYAIPVQDQRIETHRVIEINHNENGTTAIRTKGDANNGADPWTATLQKERVDVHAATIPYLGTVIRALRAPALLTTLMYGAPAVLVIMALTSIWRKPPETSVPPSGQHNGEVHG